MQIGHQCVRIVFIIGSRTNIGPAIAGKFNGYSSHARPDIRCATAFHANAPQSSGKSASDVCHSSGATTRGVGGNQNIQILRVNLPRIRRRFSARHRPSINHTMTTRRGPAISSQRYGVGENNRLSGYSISLATHFSSVEKPSLIRWPVRSGSTSIYLH